MLYGGTRILQQTAGPASAAFLTTPNGGILCRVVRTGFDSSQGNMVRMIEFSRSVNIVGVGVRSSGFSLNFCLPCFGDQRKNFG